MSYPVHYVPAGDVLPIFFNTFDKDDGSSITMTGLAVTDIEIYKDGSVTQRASDAGYTLLDTDGIDFDGLTGIHGFSIDTGDNTDSGFYTVGAWFHVVVSAVTVDAVAISFIAAAFRLMPAESVAGKPKVDTDTFGGSAGTFSSGRPEVNTTHAAGTAWGSGAITAASIASDAITNAKIAADAIGSSEIADGAITAAKIGADAITNAKIADNAIAVENIADNAITAAKIAADAIGASELAADAVTEIQSGLATASSLSTVAGYIDTEVAAIKAKTDSLTFTVANQLDVNVLGIEGSDPTNQIRDSVVDDATRIDASALNTATVTTIPAILTDTAEIGAAGAGLTEAGGTGDQLTAVPWNAAWDAEVESEATDALNAYDPPTRAELTTDINSVLTRLRGLILANGTIGSTGNDTTHVHLAGLTYGNDEIVGYYLVINDVSEGEYHVRDITDWVLATELATVDTLPFTPQNATDLFYLLAAQAAAGGSAPTAAEVADAVWDEAQADHVGVGTFGIVASEIADILVDTGTTLQAELDGIQADTEDIQSKIGTPAGASVSADVAAVKAQTAAIETDTQDIQTKIGTPAGASVSADIAAIEAQTDDIGTAGAGLTAVPWNAAWDAEVQSEVADALAAYDPPTKAEIDSAVAPLALEATAQSILEDTGTTIPATLSTIVGYIDTEVAAILADTNELQTDWVDGGRLDALIDAIKAKTDQLTFTVSNQVDANALTLDEDEILDDLLADSVPADGSLPTVRQAIYMILQFLLERSVSGTTLTVKKVDGSTSLMTFTLNDASEPTSITRSS